MTPADRGPPATPAGRRLLPRCTRGAETGRATVLIGFGEPREDAEFVALTVPDAHELVRCVQLALDASRPNLGGFPS